MLERRCVDICYVQETTFRGNLIGTVSGKAEYKIFWIRNEKGLGAVEILLPKKWVNKVIDISRVSDKRLLIR